MNSTKDSITIVCASNDHFIVLLAVLLKSIEKNNISNNKIIIYIIEDGVKSKNKIKLEQSINTDLIKINWIPLDKKILSNIKFPNDYSTYPKNIYSRLLIEHFIPTSVKKVVYMDSDMMINTDISN